MRFRGWLIAAGVALGILSWVMLRYAGMRIGIAVTLVNSIVLVLAVIFERFRYKPLLDSVPEGGDWTESGERFVDPTTGRLVRVMFSPSTGERLYISTTKMRR
jgi:hypothetical protein